MTDNEYDDIHNSLIEDNLEREANPSIRSLEPFDPRHTSYPPDIEDKIAGLKIKLLIATIRAQSPTYIAAILAAPEELTDLLKGNFSLTFDATTNITGFLNESHKIISGTELSTADQEFISAAALVIKDVSEGGQWARFVSSLDYLPIDCMIDANLAQIGWPVVENTNREEELAQLKYFHEQEEDTRETVIVMREASLGAVPAFLDLEGELDQSVEELVQELQNAIQMQLDNVEKMCIEATDFITQEILRVVPQAAALVVGVTREEYEFWSLTPIALLNIDDEVLSDFGEPFASFGTIYMSNNIPSVDHFGYFVKTSAISWPHTDMHDEMGSKIFPQRFNLHID